MSADMTGWNLQKISSCQVAENNEMSNPVATRLALRSGLSPVLGRVNDQQQLVLLQLRQGANSTADSTAVNDMMSNMQERVVANHFGYAILRSHLECLKPRVWMMIVLRHFWGHFISPKNVSIK